MVLIPLRMNTVAVTCMAMVAALGIVMRLFVRIPVVPGMLELSPGFLFSELGGVIGGLVGGAVVGAIVGIGGAVAGGEVPLMPLIGNVFLGIGTGYAIHITSDRNSAKYSLLVILGGGLIGGFVPDMTVFLALSESFEAALLAAVLDTIQGAAWAVAALMVEKLIVRPILGQYLYACPSTLSLENHEGDPDD